MAERNYLQLLAETTPTQFWNDSGRAARDPNRPRQRRQRRNDQSRS